MQTDFKSCGLLILIGSWYWHWNCINMIENVAIISGWHSLCASLLWKQCKAQLFLKETSFIFVLADRAQREQPPLKVNKKLSGLLKIAEGNMGEDFFVCGEAGWLCMLRSPADSNCFCWGRWIPLNGFFYYYFSTKEGMQLLRNVTFFLYPYQQEPICCFFFFCQFFIWCIV